MHRADLHDALRAALGDQHITLAARCVYVEQHDSEVSLGFADGHCATGDLLIGADGIDSVIRDYVAGPASQPGGDRLPGAAWYQRQSGTWSVCKCVSTCSSGRA